MMRRRVPEVFISQAWEILSEHRRFISAIGYNSCELSMFALLSYALSVASLLAEIQAALLIPCSPISLLFHFCRADLQDTKAVVDLSRSSCPKLAANIAVFVSSKVLIWCMQ